MKLCKFESRYCTQICSAEALENFNFLLLYSNRVCSVSLSSMILVTSKIKKNLEVNLLSCHLGEVPIHHLEKLVDSFLPLSLFFCYEK